MGPKHKETPPGNDVDCWPPKKAKGKQPARYQEDIRVKLEVLIPVKDVCMLGKTVWCTI